MDTTLRALVRLALIATFVLASLTPVSLAQDDEEDAPPPNPLGAYLYLTNPGLTRDAPAEGAAVQTRIFQPSTSVEGTEVDFVSNPITNLPMDWEAYTFPADYRPSGDLVITVYLTTSAAKATFHSASFYILKNGDVVTQDANQRFFPAATVDANQILEVRGATTLPAGTEFKKDDTLGLRIYVASEQAPGAAEPKIAFGSPTTPSSVYLPGLGDASDASVIRQQKFFVDGGIAFTTVEPDAVAAQTLLLAGAKLDSYAMVTVARGTVEKAMVAASDASCRVHLAVPAGQTPGVTPNRGVQCEILVDGVVKGTNGNTCAGSACIAIVNSVNGNLGPSVQSMRLGIPFKGTDIPAGAELQMRVGVLAPESTGYVATNLLYGASNRLTGIQFGALVEGGEPPASPDIVLSAEPTSQSAAPGSTAAYTIAVSNIGAADAAVSLSLDGASGSFEDGADVSVAAGETISKELLIDVAEDAADGPQEFRVLASISGQEAANLTLTLVVQADGPDPSPGPSGGPGATDPSSSEGGAANEAEGPKDTPSPALPLVMGAVLGASILLRKRRRA